MLWALQLCTCTVLLQPVNPSYCFTGPGLKVIKTFQKLYQGCALAGSGGPLRLTFALGRLENLRFFIQIICRAP